MENANTTLNYGEMSFGFSRAYPFLAGVCSGTVCQQFVSTDVLPFHSHRHTHTHTQTDEHVHLWQQNLCENVSQQVESYVPSWKKIPSRKPKPIKTIAKHLISNFVCLQKSGI